MKKKYVLHHGDCLDHLEFMPDNSVDAIVTDPPAGIGFMGKEWDHHKGGRDQWVAWLSEIMRECLRVLKPGGHALVWAIPRTSHWTATAIEDAGFEVRDRVSHVFGSGFPKSLDVSKAIDKAAGVEREVVGSRTVSNDIRGGNLIKGRATPLQRDITVPATDTARQWQGWGTALKPAMEDWWLARKPLIGTVVENVLAHGTGALNIDGCRIHSGPKQATAGRRTVGDGEGWGVGIGGSSYEKGTGAVWTNEGRWPANLIHDGSDEVVSAFPNAPGQQGDLNETGRDRISKGRYGDMPPPVAHKARNDAGSAARFFYAAKSSKKDRGEGNNHPTVKPTDLMAYLCRLVTPPNGIILDPFMGSGSTGKAALKEGFRFIGIEREKEYLDIAEARIRAVLDEEDL